MSSSVCLGFSHKKSTYGGWRISEGTNGSTFSRERENLRHYEHDSVIDGDTCF